MVREKGAFVSEHRGIISLYSKNLILSLLFFIFFKFLLTRGETYAILNLRISRRLGMIPLAKYMTKQRKILQEYLSHHIDEELSAKKVAEDLAVEGVSLSAIYRNIAQMEQEKYLVQCPKLGERELYFRYLGDEDCRSCFHLSCKICNKSKHISPEETKIIAERIGAQFTFQVDLHSTVFYGICQNCRQTELGEHGT